MRPKIVTTVFAFLLSVQFSCAKEPVSLLSDVGTSKALRFLQENLLSKEERNLSSNDSRKLADFLSDLNVSETTDSFNRQLKSSALYLLSDDRKSARNSLAGIRTAILNKTSGLDSCFLAAIELALKEKRQIVIESTTACTRKNVVYSDEFEKLLSFNKMAFVELKTGCGESCVEELRTKLLAL